MTKAAHGFCTWNLSGRPRTSPPTLTTSLSNTRCAWSRGNGLAQLPARLTAEISRRHLCNAAEEDEHTTSALPEKSRAPAMSSQRDSRVRQNRPGEEEESHDEHDAQEAGALVWQPGRGVSLWRLFFVGTFIFPLRLRVQIYLVLLLAAHLLSLFQLAIGVSSPFFVGFVGGAFLSGCAWCMMAFCYGLTILRDTSYGSDNVEWPNLLALDSFGDIVYVLTSLFFAVLPGWGIATLGQSPSGETQLFMAISTLLLFPVFLLSTLETNSPFHPFSLPVWRSVVRVQRAWILFYLLTFAVAFIAGPLAVYLSLVGVACCGSWIGTLAGVGGGAVLSIGWLIYFRLLGRLAWYCANRPLRDRVA